MRLDVCAAAYPDDQAIEVEAAEVAGDVDGFADEIKSGTDFASIVLTRGASVDAAGGDFGGAVAFGAGGVRRQRLTLSASARRRASECRRGGR